MKGNVTATIELAFAFLRTDYGYAAKVAKGEDSRPHMGGWVEYSSPQTIVRVVIERLGIVLPPMISRASDREKFGRIGDVSVERISEFAIVPEQVRRALASEQLDAVREAWRKIHAANLSLKQDDLSRGDELTADEKMELDLKSFANHVRLYADPYLRGDFTTWLDLHEYQRDWLIASQLLGHRGIPASREEIENEFWRTREYLKALRADYGKS